MTSPNGEIAVSFLLQQGANSIPVYSISLQGHRLIEPSPLGIQLDQADLTHNLHLVEVKSSVQDLIYDLPIGKNRTVRNHYRDYDILLSQTSGAQLKLKIQFRLFDDGVAYRYVIPEQPGLSQFTVVSESSKILPSEDPGIFALPLAFGSSYEAQYLTSSLRRLPSGQIFGLPLALLYDNGTYISVAEAGLHDYPQSYLLSESENGSGFSIRYPTAAGGKAPIHGQAPLVAPWRVMMIGASFKTVLESNLIANLSTANCSQDTSWIHPGKVLFQWWNGYVVPGKNFDPPESALNTRTLKKHIDFCAKYGIEYFSLDGYEFDKAWYGGDVSPYAGQDVTKAAPDINLPALLKYAKKKGVRTRVWLHTDALSNANMDHIFHTYATYGISGVMVDFMGDDTQFGTSRMENLLRTALKYHLTIAFHGNPKPTGLTREYPNYLTQEGVMGQEYNKWQGPNSTPDHEVNIAFIRGTVGPMDTHEGAFRPVPLAKFKANAIAPNSIGSLARQLAMYVVYENEQPMLIDYPEAYEKHLGAFQFIRQVPVTWDETRAIAGDLRQKYITMARRSGRDWYLGSLTGENAQSYSTPLTFLGAGRYRVEMYADTTDSSVRGESIQITTDQIVNAQDSLSINMSPAGGQAVHFRRLDGE